jgi:hypothetical protein
MATNTSTAPASSGHGPADRIPDAHALGSRREAAAEHGAFPVRERILHPLRPAERRPARIPRHGGDAPARRTTPAANAPSPAPLELAAPSGARARDLVPPTVLPDHSGDLLGLPDVAALRRGLRAAWAWAVGHVRASAEIEARLRARRDEDAAALARGGAGPHRVL